jgi:hypothetical protein
MSIKLHIESEGHFFCLDNSKKTNVVQDLRTTLKFLKASPEGLTVVL